MAAMQFSRDIAASIAEEYRLRGALSTNIPPSVHVAYQTGDPIKAFSERTRQWHLQFKLVKQVSQIAWVTNIQRLVNLHTSQILQDHPDMTLVPSLHSSAAYPPSNITPAPPSFLPKHSCPAIPLLLPHIPHGKGTRHIWTHLQW